MSRQHLTLWMEGQQLQVSQCKEFLRARRKQDADSWQPEIWLTSPSTQEPVARTAGPRAQTFGRSDPENSLQHAVARPEKFSGGHGTGRSLTFVGKFRAANSPM